MHPSPAVWFYKRSKASRGQGVFPFTQQQLQALIQTKQGQAQQEQKGLSHELGQEQQRHTAGQQPDSVSANTAPCSILSGSGTGAVPIADSGMGQARPGAVASSLQAICTVDSHDSALPSEVMDEEPDGLFQQQVPNMALWANQSSDATGAGTPVASVNAIVPSDLTDAGSDMSPGSKFDLRVLVVMGPGPSVLVGRTLFVRTTGVSFSTQALSRSVQCTNISQGGQVYAWGPKAASCAPAGDGSATPAVGSSRSGGSGDRIIIYGGSSSDSGNNCKASTSVIPPLPVIAACASVPVTQPQGSDSMHHHKRPASQETSSQQPASVAYEPVFTHVCEAVADVAVQYRSLMRDNAVHYFGFDYMLDRWAPH